MKGLHFFLRHLIVWISQNLAIPFWTIGHIHLMTTVYADVIEILSSVGMNIIVAAGFIIEYLEAKKQKLKNDQEI